MALKVTRNSKNKLRMNNTENNHRELLPFLGKRFESRSSLSPFFAMLEPDPRPGVNDFSVPFHRTAFDYCDAQYIIIRHNGQQNIVKWDWSQYSGYCVEPVSDIWFDEVCQEHALMGTCETKKYNHWEYDYNSGRFCSAVTKSIVKVKVDGKYGFIHLSTGRSNKSNPFLIAPVLDDVHGEWHRDNNSGRPVIEIVETGKTLLLTQDGVKMSQGRNLKAELEQARETLKDKADILARWIRKGMPCASRYGFAFRGAQAKPITAEEAEKLLPKYSFGKGFYELKFELLGVPTLVFNEYSENDMW